MKPLVTQQIAMDAVWKAIAIFDPGAAQQPFQQGLLPDGARSWLAALRLLSGVPFQHIVADERLLPQESARFFYIDRAWTDALIQGALSVGAVTDADRALMQQVYPAIRDDLDEAERLVRVTGGEGEVGTADALTGMLLRSRAVSGWPGIHVNAYRADVSDTSPQDDPSRLHIMRIEQLAPSVLLVIFDGVPEIVHVDEPRHGVQFGVDETGGSSPGNWSYTLTVRRNVTVNGDMTESNLPGDQLSVPFRANAPGVLDMSALQTAIVGKIGGGETASEFALQMIRLPYRQVYGPKEAVDFGSLFEATLSFIDIREWPDYRPVIALPHAREPQSANSGSANTGSTNPGGAR
jgi:hypothetical protein